MAAAEERGSHARPGAAGTGPSPGPGGPRRRHRDVSPEKLPSHFWPPELSENKFLMFQATEFVIICFFFFKKKPQETNTNIEFYGDQIGTKILTPSVNPYYY